MEKELEQFRQEAQRLRAGRAKGSGPYPEPLRAFAVRYLAQALEKGETLKSVVERLGVSEPTLQAWRRGQTPGSKKTPRSAPKTQPLLPSKRGCSHGIHPWLSKSGPGCLHGLVGPGLRSAASRGA